MPSQLPNQLPLAASLQQQLHAAAEKGALGKVQELLPFIEADAPAPDKATALHIAAAHNQIAIIQALLAHNANPNARDATQRTPLHWAAAHDREDAVALLLTHGADANAQDGYGHSPLWTALFGGHAVESLLRSLLEHGANPLLPSKRGSTPYAEALAREEEEAYKLMTPYAERHNKRT
jgi:ankyrin repeat protein